ncbi:Uncharacterised protein [Klebsiella pneumoniae subsp. pneumoniae]|uniref:Uncharacterized protein n=1 Tax=Klebsiella pneumoniae subsp. pneumoniae TaxID=72407 RepID=A0A377YT57_KLEPN|nr:Uncharacterised protein [Klebsiella pneumoniae subsp. pneumoniae]
MKLTHQQVLVLVGAVLQAQLVEVEQVAATAHGVLHRHDLSELTVSAKQTGSKAEWVRSISTRSAFARPRLNRAPDQNG